MEAVVSTENIAYCVSLMVIGILVPIIISAIYLVRKKERVTTVLVGAATFGIFAIVLESIPKLFLFQLQNPVSNYVLGHVWAYSIIGALLAGLFEEIGRYLAFRTVLKKRTEKSTAIAYGLGHGLFEVMFIMGMGGFQILMYAIMIKSGTFDLVVQQAVAAAPEQAAALESIPATIAGCTFSLMPLAIVERVGAVFFHVGASMIVFESVHTQGRKWMLPFAILLHTLFDMLAAFGQLGKITNLYVLEAIIVVGGIVIFFIARKLTATKEK